MGFIVSIIELISEFAKVLSFAFRLFGNIFGGQVLLFRDGLLGAVASASALLWARAIHRLDSSIRFCHVDAWSSSRLAVHQP